MCAIAGVVGMYTDAKIINAMLATMKRRGPDESGTYCIDMCSLIHSRLTIISPETGCQPMTLEWEGERYTIVYNGELYNTAEIQAELIALGHEFTGHSDTETLLHAYAQWHEHALQWLNGIYAFAVWHENKKRLFLARDRIGVKPLFYTHQEDGIIFSSEIKTLFAYPGMQPELDAQGVTQILMLGPGRIPGNGVFRNIYELEPGCYAIYSNGNLERKRYWKLTDREHTDTFDQTADKIRYLVTDAIKRQMISDFPLGTFLSGGLDSSLISAVCAEEMENRGEKLKTFSVDYANNEKYFVPGKFQPNSDNFYIDKMQRYLHADHFWTVLTPEDLVGELEDSTIARDLPGMADVDFSFMSLCRQIRKEVKVALSGECADEIFGGYPWYTDPEIRAIDGFPWAQNTKHRASFLQPWLKEKVDPEQFVRDLYQQTVSQTDILPETDAQEMRMKQMVNLNYRWFMQTLLDRKDRMSMYSGLEVRVPFCDHRIAEYLYSVPWKFKFYQNREKGLLRYAMRGLLPDTILYRKKSPYPKTYDPKYFELVSQMLRRVIERKNAPILQIVPKQTLENLLTSEYEWPWYGQLMKVPQTVAYMLQINFWMEHYRVALV